MKQLCFSNLFPIDFVVWEHKEKEKILQKNEEAVELLTRDERISSDRACCYPSHTGRTEQQVQALEK